MNEKVLKYLYDIKLAIDEIDSFFAGKKKYFTDYASDLLLKRAIEIVMNWKSPIGMKMILMAIPCGH